MTTFSVHTKLITAGVTVVLGLSGAVSLYAQSPGAPEVPRSVLFGRTAEVWAVGTRSTGELIAVTGEHLWMDPNEGERITVPLADVSRIRVQMHDFGLRRVVLWNVIGALGTGVALTAACTSVEDTNCGGVVLAVAIPWLLVGGIAGGAIARSSVRDLAPRPDAVRPHVRFPQGLPPD